MERELLKKNMIDLRRNAQQRSISMPNKKSIIDAHYENEQIKEAQQDIYKIISED